MDSLYSRLYLTTNQGGVISEKSLSYCIDIYQFWWFWRPPWIMFIIHYSCTGLQKKRLILKVLESY